MFLGHLSSVRVETGKASGWPSKIERVASQINTERSAGSASLPDRAP